jgi:S1-C subfamily serine protease
MAVSALSTLSRVCPACGRRVAPPAMSCRCGKSVEGIALTAPPPRLPLKPPPDSDRLEAAAKIAIATVGILAAGFMLYRATLANRTAPAAVSAAPASASARSSAAAAPAAAQAPSPSAALPAEPSPAPASDAPAEPTAAREPTALERVMAAAAASRRAELSAAGALEPRPASPAPAGLEDIISRAMPAVVRVETATGFGSGFFITPDTMLTNVHVVGANTSVTIRRPDGKTTMARVDRSAPELDIAVIRISNPDANQPTLTMGSGAKARAGQEVIALGTPLGLQNTVTRGIVSAIREVGGLTLVQTDAAINPGNSGGPLLDRSGQVIGITTMNVKSSDAQGLGFAVAIEHAQTLLAGGASIGQRGTPVSRLNESMSGRAGLAPAATDASRDRGTKAYGEAIAALANRADTLDERWRAFKRICYQGTIAPTPGREWFAVWDPHAMQGTVPQGCTSAFADIQHAADGIRDGVLEAGEAARQADVYPGARREVLQRYRLNYAGWDR